MWVNQIDQTRNQVYSDKGYHWLGIQFELFWNRILQLLYEKSELQTWIPAAKTGSTDATLR